jgi:translocator protein
VTTGVASTTQLRWSLARAVLVIAPLVLLLGALSARLAGSSASNPWFAALVKPDIYPPAALFGIAWTILYLMIGVAAAVVWSARGSSWRWPALGLFALQLIANLAWSPLFFRFHRIDAALGLAIGIFALTLLTTLGFGLVRRLAAALMIPYLAWLGFAAVLTWRIHELNPNGGPDVSIASVRMALPSQE